MRPAVPIIAALLLAVGLTPGASAQEVVASSHDGDDHSDNMQLVANWDDDGEYATGSDLAFWGDLAVAGMFDAPGGFLLMDISDPDDPQLVARMECPGPQNDVSIWGDLVFLSVDQDREDTECGAGGASSDQIAAGEGWSGIRIFDISDPSEPEQIRTVRTDCGSHTHTLLPDEDQRRVFVYVSSYPLRDQGPDCGEDSHGKVSVIEVALDRPTEAEVVSMPDVSPAAGCHDVTVFLEHDLAAAACISETQLWDISDPVEPEIIAHVRNPSINIHHSTTFSWDAEVLVIGDEMGGAAGAGGCFTGGHDPTGALWFYDVTDPENPEILSFFAIPEQEASILCTAHQFNVVPLEGDERILVVSWYNGGTHVLDFTDPEDVQRIGYYIPQEGGRATAFASYWYNGHIYANNFDESYVPPIRQSRGFDVFAIDHPALEDHIELERLNPYTLEPLPRVEDDAAPDGAETGHATSAPPPDDGPGLPATGAPGIVVLVGLLSIAGAAVMRPRRTGR